MLEQTELALVVKQGRIEWSGHALQRMLERGVSRESIKHIICYGENIESYPDDQPFPRALFFGMWDNKPLHSVVAHDKSTQKIFVITAYQPDTKHFESDFKARRKNENRR